MRIGSLSRYWWRFIRKPPQLAYAIGLGPLLAGRVLLLTTTGRRTGKARVTPLQYEEVEGQLLIGSARGTKADWVRNILAEPRVRVQIGSRRIAGRAEVSADPERVADFIALRLRRHPRMIGAILRAEGLPAHPNREELVAYAGKTALVTIRPL